MLRRLLIVLALGAVLSPAVAGADDVVLQPGQQASVTGTDLVVRDAGTFLFVGIVGPNGYVVPNTIWAEMNGGSASLNVFPSGGLGEPALPARSVFTAAEPGAPPAGAPDLTGKLDLPGSWTTAVALQPGRDRIVWNAGNSTSVLGPVNMPQAGNVFLSLLFFGSDGQVVPQSKVLLVGDEDARAASVDASRTASLVFQLGQPRETGLGHSAYTPAMAEADLAAAGYAFTRAKSAAKPLVHERRFTFVARGIIRMSDGAASFATDLARMAAEVRISVSYDDGAAACSGVSRMEQGYKQLRQDVGRLDGYLKRGIDLKPSSATSRSLGKALAQVEHDSFEARFPELAAACR